MYNYNFALQKQQFFNEANEYLSFILKNGTKFKQCETLNALVVVKNEIDKNPDIYSNFYTFSEESDYKFDLITELSYIFENGNEDNKNEALDWLFIIKDETEEENKFNGNNIIQFPAKH